MFDAEGDSFIDPKHLMAAAFFLLERRLGLTAITAIGPAIGINRNTIAAYQRGRTPSMDFVLKVCSATSISFTHFFIVVEQFAEGVSKDDVMIPLENLSSQSLELARRFDDLDPALRQLLLEATPAQIAYLNEVVKVSKALAARAAEKCGE